MASARKISLFLLDMKRGKKHSSSSELNQKMLPPIAKIFIKMKTMFKMNKLTCILTFIEALITVVRRWKEATGLSTN